MHYAIRIENLSKRYRLRKWGSIYSYKSLRDSITNFLRSPVSAFRFRNQSNNHKFLDDDPDGFIWALKDLTFDIEQGEVLGIIGRNGAGKSTLLKILSRITEPTTGCAVVQGRVGSLLEVGTGFHPELTGRENIYFNGSFLGMKKNEIDRRFDEIVSFAEVEKFIDTPVKHYSSGMYIRLAFAVAAHLDTEILLVDEVLAVGDVSFQRKCLGKMGDVAHSGRTVLFVSHTMNVISQLCREAIVLDHGRLVLKAPATEAISEYLSETAGRGGSKTWPPDESHPMYGSFRPVSLAIRDPKGTITDQVSSSDPITIDIEYKLLEPVRDLRVGVMISAGDGTFLFGAFDADDSEAYVERRSAGYYRSRCYVPSNWLNQGRFIVGVYAGIFNVGRLFQDEHALIFNLTKTGGPGSHWGEISGGYLRPMLDWKVECLEEFAKQQATF